MRRCLLFHDRQEVGLAYRLVWLLALAALPAFPVSKEMLQLQRDMAQLQEQIRGLQRTVDERFAVTQQLLNQGLEASTKLSNGLAALERTVETQEKALVAPVANVNTRMDTLASQFQSLREAVQELNSKLSKLETQVVDIKNIVSTVPAPAAPAAPSPQAQAETLFKSALRDYQAANFNLAGPQFAEYVKTFGTTDQAADAQYYLGEIFFQQQQYDQAVAAFEQVLERYPEGKRTPDAQFKKGHALLKQGKRDAAVREFRGVISKYPNTPAANQAAEALKGLGLSARTAPAPVKKAPRRK